MFRAHHLLAVLLIACGPRVPDTPAVAQAPAAARDEQEPMAWPDDWSTVQGERVTLQGTAADAKLGAMLLGPDGRSIWVDRSSWPEGFYRGGSEGERVQVTGVVTVREDVPVVLVEPGEPVRAGVPVTSEEEIESARRRFVLTEFTFEVIAQETP